MMDEMGYYDAGIKVGKKYEQKRILRFLDEKKKRNAKVVSISELTEFIKDGGRFQRLDEVAGAQGCVGNATDGTD